MPTHLPFDDIVIEPEEDCSGCDKIGEDVTWEYEYKPGTLFIRRYIRPKYSRLNNSGIAIGTLPNRPVEKGNFGPGIMAAVTADKYLYHLPLNRQKDKFQNEFGVTFAESVLCDIISRTVFWMEPVYEIQKKDLLKSSYLQADETTIPVLIKNKKGKTHKGYYWVYYDPVRKIVIYEYQHGRSRAGPNNFLKDFSGTLQVDGYAGYNELVAQEHVIRAACMAHVRRKFENALEYDKGASEYALQIIGKWFTLEREAKAQNATATVRLEMRMKLAAEFKSFKDWMMQQALQRIPSDLIRKACEYGLGQWEGFTPYLTDGRIELSNNLVENAIRPIAVGRKNYLFKGSEKAAQRGAIIYSLIATAKMHGWDPYKYVKMLLEKLPAEKANNINCYLPYMFEPEM
jgi:transposase